MHSEVKIARITGVLYLGIVIFGLVAQVFVRDALVDYGDPSITAENIRDSEFLYRIGFVSELFMLICDAMVTALLYILLVRVNKPLTLISTFLRLVSIICLAGFALHHYTALYFLDDTALMSAFTATQLNAMSLLSIKLHGAGYNISLLFFGVHLLFLGRLVVLSRILPKFLGVLLSIAGVCYVVNSLTWFLYPPGVKLIYPAILIPCFLAELLFAIWLVAKRSADNKQGAQQSTPPLNNM